MKVSIVEDDTTKLARVVAVLRTLPDAEVSIHRSYNSGLRGLLSSPPQMAILDMTLPSFDRTPGGLEGRSRPLGGYEIMRKLKLRGKLTPILVLTALESFGEGPDSVSRADITHRCSSEFPDYFLGTVFYSSAEAWTEQLRKTYETLRGV